MTIYILFGEMGVGKNHIGEQLAAHLGCDFFDGDNAFPPNLKEKIKRCESLTKREVRSYVLGNLIPCIVTAGLHSKSPDLVVAQALYIQEHRDIISWSLADYQIEWVHIKPPSFLTHMRRLCSRESGLKWMLLGLISKAAFQEPPSGTLTIESVQDIDVASV